MHKEGHELTAGKSSLRVLPGRSSGKHQDPRGGEDSAQGTREETIETSGRARLQRQPDVVQAFSKKHSRAKVGLHGERTV